MQKSFCSEAGIQGCGLEVVFVPLLRGLLHLPLRDGHDAEVGALEMGCLAFEVGLRLSVESGALPLWQELPSM